jgi:ATP-dependent Zn protease
MNMATHIRSREEEEATAHHEAGHAVLAVYLNLGFEHVTIEANEGEDASGITMQLDEWHENTQEMRLHAEEAFWQRRATMLYAGVEAHRRFAPSADCEAGAGSDYRSAADAIERITADAKSQDALHSYTRRRAQLLVEHYWPEIKALAGALLKDRSLNSEQIREILRASLMARKARLLSW